MEDVVVHYRCEPAGGGVTSLLQSTEELLKPFPCRPPPPFTPWFPSTEPRPLPIRPAKPAPVITSGEPPPRGARPRTATTTTSSPGNHRTPAVKHQDVGPAELTGSPTHLLPPPLHPKPNGGVAKPHSQEGATCTGAALERRWSVFARRGARPHGSRSPSKDFGRMVSVHRLRPHQRAKWVITEQSCGSERDMEQAWRAVSRCVRSGVLPGCNAHLQRERGEMWVFCDVLHSEQVGGVLKEALQLQGNMVLWVHRRGNVFTL